MKKTISLCFIGLFFFLSQNINAAPNDGLVAYLPFDGNLNDASENNNNGQENQTIRYDTGIVGNALKLDGTGNGWVTIPFNQSLTMFPFTVSAFVRFDNSTGSLQNIFSKKHDELACGVYPNGSSSSIEFKTCVIGNSNCHWSSPKININPGEWHHYAFAFDGSTKYTYFDGNLVKTDNFSISTPDWTNSVLSIGAFDYGPYPINGAIDEFRVYNRVLSSDEVMNIFTDSAKADEVLSSIDLTNSGIDYSTGKAIVKFKIFPNAPGLMEYTAEIDGNKVCSHLYTLPIIDSQFECQLSKDMIDKTIKVTIKHTDLRLETIPTIQAAINMTYDQIQARAPDAVTASASLAETKINLSDPLNNLFNFFENQNYLGYISRYSDRFRLQVGTATTHRIIDFDRIASKAINTQWQQTSYSPKSFGKRIPILLIHGWQGDNADFQDRQQSALLSWSNSELRYWQHFLDYYLTSKKLQEKFHIYLYHYPTYKHITFNAKELKKLLLNSTTGTGDLSGGLSNNKLVIIGHSMGGLVGRALIEEHEFDNYTKLITLDTPHHGSPVSVDDGLPPLAKDLGTQGAADLNWDNVDKVDLDQDIDSNNTKNRWAHINTKQFDALYWNKLQTLVGNSNIDQHHSKNPWLHWLNINFTNNKDTYKHRYIFYAAASSSTLNQNSKIPEAIYNGNDFDFSILYLNNKGYTTGGAEPTGSALFCAFDPSSYTKNDLINYFNPSNTYDFKSIYSDLKDIDRHTLIFTDKDNDPQYIISAGNEHPYGIPYRIFFDYDHEMMVNGTYNCGVGCWDNFINLPFFMDRPVTLATVDIFGHVDPSESAFEYKILLSNEDQPYCSYRKNIYSYAYGQALSPSLYLNPLQTEPLFLALRKDLLDIAASNPLEQPKGINTSTLMLLF